MEPPGCATGAKAQTVIVSVSILSILMLGFYRPSSSSVEIFSQVSTYFDSLCITQFSNLIFLGDFNVNGKDLSHPCFRNVPIWPVTSCK